MMKRCAWCLRDSAGTHGQGRSGGGREVEGWLASASSAHTELVSCRIDRCVTCKDLSPSDCLSTLPCVLASHGVASR